MVYYSSIIYESIECAESKTVSLLLGDRSSKEKTSKCVSKMTSLKRGKNNVVCSKPRTNEVQILVAKRCFQN